MKMSESKPISTKSSKSNLQKGLMKTCRVCGDNGSTIAFNYNGLSCESCKSFFFRNALRGQELVCNRNTCEITVKTRRKCAKCRLQKCFKIGMKKELIAKSKSQTEVFQKITSKKQEIDLIKHELLNSRSLHANNKDELQFPALSNHERAKLEEVSGYYNCFKEEGSIKTVLLPPNRAEYLRICEEFGMEIVRTIKNIPVMKSYSMKDKMIMAPNYVNSFSNLRHALYWDAETETGLVLEMKEQKCCYRMGNIWADIMPEEVWKEMVSYVVRNKAFLLDDPLLRDLTATLSLFQHNAGVSCPEVLRLHYLEYYYLIRRYLQVKLRTKVKFEKHMVLLHDVLDNFPKNIQCFRKFYEKNTQHMQMQLLTEVFQKTSLASN